MWKRFIAWHRAWEADQLRMLEDPGALIATGSPMRSRMAAKVARMSPIERAQLREFTLAYRGRRGYLALAKLIVLFSALGLALHLVLPAPNWVALVVVTNFVGLAGSAFLMIAYFNYRRMAGEAVRTALVLVVFAAAAALVGARTMAHSQGISVDRAFETSWFKTLLYGAGAGLFFALPMAVVGALRNRQYEALTAKLELDAERERAARTLSETRLRMLHAQIEPHFLFNTLGAVQQLAEKDAPRAAELTANLIAFLRASLSEMRSEQVTLAADFGLVEAYLQVMAARLGARLLYRLELAPQLAAVNVPSMMLLTLVENAIKHGIEPSLRGGEVVVSARSDGATLTLAVRDSGAGLGAQAGAGEGLANVRSRLQLLYGAHGALVIGAVPDGGVLAEITLPMGAP
ncbi:MAG: histidine kinase [Pseudomonadota bacterium]